MNDCEIVGLFGAVSGSNGSWVQTTWGTATPESVTGPLYEIGGRNATYASLTSTDESQTTAAAISYTGQTPSSVNSVLPIAFIVALAPVQTGTIAGTITNADTGAPVAGATVTATDSAGHQYTTTTDINGYYTLTVPAS